MQAKKPVTLKAFAPGAEQEEAAPVPAKPSKEKFQKVFILTAEQNDQLEALCYHSKMTIQAVAIEGINMVLRSKGLPELKS
jgi:hypothetical protein